MHAIVKIHCQASLNREELLIITYEVSVFRIVFDGEHSVR